MYGSYKLRKTVRFLAHTVAYLLLSRVAANDNLGFVALFLVLVFAL